MRHLPHKKLDVMLFFLAARDVRHHVHKPLAIAIGVPFNNLAVSREPNDYAIRANDSILGRERIDGRRKFIKFRDEMAVIRMKR